MKKIRKKIIVPASEAEAIKKFLSMQPESEDQCLGENETMTYTAQFGTVWKWTSRYAAYSLKKAVITGHGQKLYCLRMAMNCAVRNPTMCFSKTGH